MSVGRTAARLGAVLVGLAGLALAFPTLAATTTSSGKKCCAVEIRGLADTVTVGGDPVNVDLGLSGLAEGCTQVRRNITVRLDGLAPDQVRIERVLAGTSVVLPLSSTAAGVVRAADQPADPAKVCGEDSFTLRYRFTLLRGAPTGEATLAVEASSAGGKLLGSDTVVSAVVAAVAQPGPGEQNGQDEPAVPQPAQTGAGNPAADATGESTADEPVAESTVLHLNTPSAEPADRDRGRASAATGTPAWSRLSAETIATGLGVASVGVMILGLTGFRMGRRRPTAPPAEEGFPKDL